MGSAYLRALGAFHLLRRPMTVGVRGAAFDEKGRVFLVRHSYLSGWYLPGGGVERGETAGRALERELEEEGRLAWEGEARLLSVHLSRTGIGRDHVLLYRVDGARMTSERAPDREIAEVGFFSLDALPETTTPATRRRLAELATGAPPDPDW